MNEVDLGYVDEKMLRDLDAMMRRDGYEGLKPIQVQTWMRWIKCSLLRGDSPAKRYLRTCCMKICVNCPLNVGDVSSLICPVSAGC